MTSSNGVILKRANENSECCLDYSVFVLEDDHTYEVAPLVEKNGGCVTNYADRLTLQQWVDLTVSRYKIYGNGLCVEGWRHIVQGT